TLFGEQTTSCRHEVNAFFTYLVPKVDVMFGSEYQGLSGRPFTPFAVYTSSQLSIPLSSRRTVFLEPRGSRRNDFFNQLDLRVEKVVTVQGHRFGVYADTVNLFNNATITARQARVPSSGGIAFLAPTTIQGARQVTFGGRWSF